MAVREVQRTAMLLFFLLNFLALSRGMEGRRLLSRGCPCGDTYTVKDGDTLHSISQKCNDPFLMVDNPQVGDSDDLAAGVVLKMQCSQKGISLCDFAGLLPAKLCQS